MEKKFSIKVISDTCGVLPHTIRTWEQRYQAFSPERSEGGQRLYSEKDLIKAKLLVKLVEQGNSISVIAKYTIYELEAMEKLLKNNDNSGLNRSVSTKKLLKQLSGYKIDLIASELQHFRLSLGVKEFIFNIVLPMIREVGLMVYEEKYTVTQEHIVSTLIRDQLSQIHLPNIGSKLKEVALATPEGNLHELPIIIADILCRANRVTTRYLGAAHPPTCLGQAINALKSPFLVLGVLSTDHWNYERDIISYLKQVDSFLDQNLTVILGGATPMDFPAFEKIKEVKVIATLDDFDDFLEKL